MPKKKGAPPRNPADSIAGFFGGLLGDAVKKSKKRKAKMKKKRKEAGY